MLEHTFHLCKALTFAIFFLCVWKILHLYSFCSVYCGCYLYPVSTLLCNAGVKSHKLYSSGSFARFHQWTTLAGDVEEGEKPPLTHFFFFLLWVVALEAAVPLPLSLLFKWYSPPLFLLLRWQLVPRRGPSSLVSLGFGKVAGSCLLQSLIWVSETTSFHFSHLSTLGNQFPLLNFLWHSKCVFCFFDWNVISQN